jgi:hypothetical protein
MARNRTATSVLKQRGAFEKNPQRGRDREFEPIPKAILGNPHKCLTELQVECWRELVAMAPDGVLMDSDAWAVEIASRVMAKLRQDGELPSTQWAILISALAKMGLTPADRSKVMIQKTDGEDEDAKFFGETHRPRADVQ